MKDSYIKVAAFILRIIDFQLYYRFCWLIVRNLQGTRIVKVLNFYIKFESNDPYWSRLISKRFRYEIELENWLKNECSSDEFFIDCGANIGYWSIFVSKIIGVKKFIAIEPNPRIFQMLLDNLKLNQLPQMALEGAIGDLSHGASTTNLYLDTSPGLHVGASIYRENISGVEILQVPLIGLCDVLEQAIQSNSSILLKLDVEGAEVLCFQQIPISMRSRVRIIYEDHGRDLDCVTTKWLLASKAYKIYFLQTSGSIEITSIDTLSKLKKSKKKGYNLIAIPIYFS